MAWMGAGSVQLPAYSVRSGSEGILVVTCRVTLLDNPLYMLSSEWILGLSVPRRKESDCGFTLSRDGCLLSA